MFTQATCVRKSRCDVSPLQPSAHGWWGKDMQVSMVLPATPVEPTRQRQEMQMVFIEVLLRLDNDGRATSFLPRDRKTLATLRSSAGGIAVTAAGLSSALVDVHCQLSTSPKYQCDILIF